MRRVTPRGDPQARLTALADAVSVIHRGGIVAIPTDTLYGLAVDPFSSTAVSRLFAAKGRAGERAVALVAADVEQVVRQLGELPEAARRLASRYWPGPLTLLLDRPASLPGELTGNSHRVGVRVPNCDMTRELCRACGHLLTATSANISGEAASDDPDVVARVFAESDVELLLDAGRSPGGPPSTIVDVLDHGIRLIRPGAIAWDEVQACVPPE
jgi:L-threonylcarbamoyladenylate synthase